ncbi:MAG: S8 family serine peptidase, partial [Rubrivivax sp.]
MRPLRFLSLLALHALSVLGLALASPAEARAADPAVPGEILLKLRTADALPALLSKYSLTLAARFGARPIFRVQVIGAASVEKTLDALAAEPAVLIAERNFVHSSPEARRNLPWTIGAASAYQAQWAPDALRLPQAQALATGRGVRVAVLDTGVDFTHPALAGRLLPGRDFVDGDLDASEAGTPANLGFGHGTHVAGLVALVAPAAQIVPLRVLDAEGNGNAWVLAEALLHAVDPDGNPATDDGAHVINRSLGSLSR